MSEVELDDLLGRYRVRERVAAVERGGPLPVALHGGGPGADLVAGALVARLREPRALFAVVDAWLAAHAYRLPRRSGDAGAEARASGVFLGTALRAALEALFAAGSPPLGEREQFLLVYLWRQVFLNPYSTLSLFGPPPPEAPEGAGLVVQSLRRPFDAPALPALDAEALFGGPMSLAEKMVVALWLVALPEVGLSVVQRDRCLANAIAVCRGARAALPPPVAFSMLVDEVMSGLFRASYAGGNTCAALSALGDLVAAGAPSLVRPFPAPVAGPARPRPRVGYVSTNLRSHSVGYYMASRILRHDRGGFEVVVFTIGRRRDPLTARIAAAAEHVELTREDDLSGIAHAVRARELDLLVFPDIGMSATTLLLAGLRLAPRQIALMGHATTTGLPTLSHYLGGDHEGPDAQAHYREQLVRLPNLGAAQLAPPAAAPRDWRRELGIPDDAVVFVNLNNAIKLPPARDHVYLEILARLPAAHLILKPFFEAASVDERLERRLRDAAAARGIAGRLHLLPPLPGATDLFAVLAVADVHLDTFPFGGWTTNLDALHAGLPLVTQEGEVGRSRWGAELLRRMGIEEGIARDADEYVAWAVRLGGDRELRARLAARVRERAPGLFFDGAAAQPAYEEALRAILA